MVVPGSGLVKKQAEEEGLDQIFTSAGIQWCEPGCSMCLAMNLDQLGGKTVSTSNRKRVLGENPPVSPAIRRSCDSWSFC